MANKRRFGRDTDRMIHLCIHSRKVFEAMADFLDENVKPGDVPAVELIDAGDEINRGFNDWFLYRPMIQKPQT